MRSAFLNRRNVLQILAGGAALAAAGPARANDARIARLIGEAAAFPEISRRIDFISRALLGSPYRGHTLIGGPQLPEKFVARDDVFDCVTYCETVLAAAMAREPGEFEASLRTIRYHNGVVSYRERNHYFFEWGRHNVDNKTCRPVVMGGEVALEKTVYWHRELGRRRFAMSVIPRAVFLANKAQLINGDIIGFITRRPYMDYFHVGFVTFGRDGALTLRHASQTRGRVVDDGMEWFLGAYGVRHVTLLRAEEPPAATVAAKKDI